MNNIQRFTLFVQNKNWGNAPIFEGVAHKPEVFKTVLFDGVQHGGFALVGLRVFLLGCKFAAFHFVASVGLGCGVPLALVLIIINQTKQVKGYFIFF
ncbi:hypothetical protein CMI37_31140 [Candidatus Pacearchaeota archaeon]|nr:hypothetical protein [Candidatus Pacearchaeota archaeon]